MVKMIPAPVLLIALAIVWLILFSTIVLRRSMPRSTPQPIIAAISEPTTVKPINRPA